MQKNQIKKTLDMMIKILHIVFAFLKYQFAKMIVVFIVALFYDTPTT
jgi:hypothetical protein